MKRILISMLIGASIMGVLICLYGIGRARGDGPSYVAAQYAAEHPRLVCDLLDSQGVSKATLVLNFKLLEAVGISSSSDAAWITVHDVQTNCPEYWPSVYALAKAVSKGQV